MGPSLRMKKNRVPPPQGPSQHTGELRKILLGSLLDPTFQNGDVR